MMISYVVRAHWMCSLRMLHECTSKGHCDLPDAAGVPWQLHTQDRNNDGPRLAAVFNKPLAQEGKGSVWQV